MDRPSVRNASESRRFRGVPLQGRRIELQRLGRRHLPALYDVCTEDEVIAGWPLFGVRVELEYFGAYLGRIAELQFAIVRRDNGAAIGLLQAVNIDLRSGTADLALVVSSNLWKAGWPLEGVVLGIDILFRGFGIRKIYVSATESLKSRFGTALDKFLSVEGVLRQHVLVDGRYEDLTILALYRYNWDSGLVSMITGNRSIGTIAGRPENVKRAGAPDEMDVPR